MKNSKQTSARAASAASAVAGQVQSQKLPLEVH